MTLTSREPAGTEITYGEFGVELFHQVLSEGRVAESVAGVLGDVIAVGPFGAGPGRRLATVQATGSVGRPVARRLPGNFVGFHVDVPLDVAFDVAVAGDVHRFRAAVSLPLRLTARAVAPLTIRFDITPPTEDELALEVTVDKRRTALLRRVAGIDEELRGFLCRYVNRELEKEHVLRATRIPLGEIIDAAWPLIAARLHGREADPDAPASPVGST